jgi:predicted DCC family thiol-disulfide oxidoreductase YuxK
MKRSLEMPARTPPPLLLFNGECAVCRRIARWVQKSARRRSGSVRITAQPIGDDPQALRALNPNLDIWDAYATIHLLMPDGSMKVGGEAVAEVLRRLPNCAWFAGIFAVRVFGFQPFQLLLDAGYVVLADVRPLLGCESCGIPSPAVKFVGSLIKRAQRAPKARVTTPHFTSSTRPS